MKNFSLLSCGLVLLSALSFTPSQANAPDDTSPGTHVVDQQPSYTPAADFTITSTDRTLSDQVTDTSGDVLITHHELQTQQACVLCGDNPVFKAVADRPLQVGLLVAFVLLLAFAAEWYRRRQKAKPWNELNATR